MIKTDIIAVYADNQDRQILLGYAKGNDIDIAAYFDDRKAYGLELRTVEYIEIPSGYAGNKAALAAQAAELEKQLKELNNKIKGLK